MGWTEKVAKYYKRGKIDRKEEVRDYLECDNEDVKISVLKASMKGNVYYGVVEGIYKKNDKKDVFGIVVLTSVRDRWYIAFKEMDETMHPYYYDMPKNMLDMLSPTTNESALKWRENCYKKIEEKKTKPNLSKMDVGSKIKFTINVGCYVHYNRNDVVELEKVYWRGKKIWLDSRKMIKWSSTHINKFEIEAA